MEETSSRLRHKQWRDNLLISGEHKTGWLEHGPGEDKNLNEAV